VTAALAAFIAVAGATCAVVALLLAIRSERRARWYYDRAQERIDEAKATLDECRRIVREAGA
jgi:hypothetical protein